MYISKQDKLILESYNRVINEALDPAMGLDDYSKKIEQSISNLSGIKQTLKTVLTFVNIGTVISRGINAFGGDSTPDASHADAGSSGTETNNVNPETGGVEKVTDQGIQGQSGTGVVGDQDTGGAGGESGGGSGQEAPDTTEISNNKAPLGLKPYTGSIQNTRANAMKLKVSIQNLANKNPQIAKELGITVKDLGNGKFSQSGGNALLQIYNNSEIAGKYDNESIINLIKNDPHGVDKLLNLSHGISVDDIKQLGGISSNDLYNKVMKLNPNVDTDTAKKFAKEMSASVSNGNKSQIGYLKNLLSKDPKNLQATMKNLLAHRTESDNF